MDWEQDTSTPWRLTRWCASAVVGRTVGRLAVDVTASSTRRSCLVLAPHPDDESLGCGATIARKAHLGTRVRVFVLSDGATWPPGPSAAENVTRRHGELLEAVEALGLPRDALVHGSFPEMGLGTAVEELSDAVADAVRAFRPDDVYCTSPVDPHPDHGALGRATRRALTGSSVRILEYPVWQWHHPGTWLRMLKEGNRPEAVRTAEFMDQKRRALAMYRSQISMSRKGAPDHTIRPPLLRHFLTGREVFFPHTEA